jgi:two-component system, NarL family, nitrate/nitrite response regulator NarL
MSTEHLFADVAVHEVATSVSAPITILIAVGVRLYREGLAAALASHDRLSVRGTAATPHDAQNAARDLQPDIVIVDVALEGASQLMQALRAECEKIRILAFAVRDDIAAILGHAEAGADGFVTANGSLSELVEAIRRTAAGELLCSPQVAAQLLRRAARRNEPAPGDAGLALTGRERQVYSLLKQGLSNKEIAHGLTIAEATVKNHVHHLLEKLHVSSRGQAIAIGLPTLKAARHAPAPSRRAG